MARYEHIYLFCRKEQGNEGPPLAQIAGGGYAIVETFSAQVCWFLHTRHRKSQYIHPRTGAVFLGPRRL